MIPIFTDNLFSVPANNNSNRNKLSTQKKQEQHLEFLKSKKMI